MVCLRIDLSTFSYLTKTEAIISASPIGRFSTSGLLSKYIYIYNFSFTSKIIKFNYSPKFFSR